MRIRHQSIPLPHDPLLSTHEGSWTRLTLLELWMALHVATDKGSLVSGSNQGLIVITFHRFTLSAILLVEGQLSLDVLNVEFTSCFL